MCASWNKDGVEKMQNSEIDDYSEIFYGKLIDVFPVDIETEDGVASYGKKYTFEVFEKWVGNNSRIVEFFQISIGCNFHFGISNEYEEVGSNWIVSLKKENFPWIEYPSQLQDSVFTTNLCDLNMKEKDEGFGILKTKLNQFFPNKITLESKPNNYRTIQIITLVVVAFLLGLIFGKKFNNK